MAANNHEPNIEPLSGIDASGGIDQINNVTQKEREMKKAGVTRYKYLKVIAEALEAEKMIDVVMPNGNVVREMGPDTRRREWGAEMAAKLSGDMIEHKEIVHDIGDKTLERFKAYSVAELKEKARHILDAKAVITQSRIVEVEEDI